MLSQPSDSESEHNYLGIIQPTLNDVLLALTLPPSALALSVWMPKRRRERILEVTKTVTVTELSNPYPELLQNRQNTVSNIELGDGHPVTLHISQMTDQYETSCTNKESLEDLDFTYRNPLINCDDDEDVIETVHTVNEKFIQFPESIVVDVQPKVNPSNSGTNVDNIIDISFDTSRKDLSETSGNKKSHLSAYFRPSRSLDVLLLSPTDTGFYTSPNRSGLVDGTESDGSMIIHTDDERRFDSGVSSVTGIRIRGNKDQAKRPLSSDDDDELIYLPAMATTSSTLPRSSRKRAREGRKYIVTSLKKSQSNPSIYLNTPDNVSASQKIRNSVSQGDINSSSSNDQDGSTNRSHLYIKNSCKPLHSYTVTAVTETVNTDVPTNSERDLSIHKITVDLELDRLQQSGSHLNEIIRIENIYQNEISHIPPKMSSTPFSTLEKNRKRSHQINQGVKIFTSADGVEVHVSNTEEANPSARYRTAVSPIIVVNQSRSRKGSMDNLNHTPKEIRRKSTVTDIDWFAAFNMKEPLTPRSPRSPMPLDALKECERYVIENGLMSRKIPPASIEVDDIFRCVNDGSLNSNVCSCSACTLSKIPDEELRALLRTKMEATQNNSYIYPEDTAIMTTIMPSSIPVSAISIDDLFQTSSESSVRAQNEIKQDTSHLTNSKYENCTPRKTSIPDANVTVDDLFEDSQTQVPTRSIESIEGTVQPSETVSNITSTDLDISIDDLFAGTSSETHKRNSIDFDKYIQRGRELKNNSSVGFNSTVAQTESLESTRRKSSIPDANVTVDDLFEDSQTQVPTRSIESIEGTVQPSETVSNITSTDLDISIDDVFAGTSSETHKRNSIDFDKYIQRGRELKNNSSVGFNSTVAQTESLESTRRKSSIPDANVTVDDLFEDSQTQVPTRSIDLIERTVQPSETIRNITSTNLDISIDDLFAGTSSETHKRNSIDFDKYIQRGRELKNNSSVGFNSTVAQTESLESTRRKSTIPDANVTVDDLFEDSQTQVPTRSIDLIERTVQPSETVSNITSTDLDISIDDVFAGTSSETHKRNSIDFDKYIQRGRELKNNSSVGFNSTVAQTESQESTRRKSSIPDANVTVDDLFEDFQTQVPTRSIESIEGTVEPSETIRNITSTDLDISIDDVFAGTSSETHKRNSIDFDKYIQRGRELKNNSSIGFNSTVAQTESLESTRRKSSIPDANVTVDDLFEDSQTQVPTRSIDLIERTVKPSETVSNITSTDLDISIDDVFAGTSSETHKRNSIDFDKYIQRGRELKNNSSVGFNSTVAQTESLESTRRKSSIPDANVTVDDLFEDSQTQVPTRSIESIEGTVEPSETIRNITSTDLDISIYDVFAGTSSETHKRNSIDFDKYIQRGRELKNNSSVGFNSTVAQTESLESTRRKSSIPDANVTVDDLFEDSQTQVPTKSIDLIERTVQPSETVSNITSTDLDISIDDVFAGTSSETHKRNSIDSDKYIQRGRELKNNSSVGFNSTVAQTESQESTRRKSSIPDAIVTVDDLFEDSQTQVPTRSIDLIERTVKPSETVSNITSTDLDISIDDVFAGTSSETHKRNSIDSDKYIQRGRELKNNSSVGFNSTVAQTESQESTRRKSSIPDANVTVDDLFEDSQTQVPTRSIESIEGTVQPSETVSNITSTDLDISIDDVFAGTSGETHKRNSIDFDKYIQRGRELKNNSSVGFNSTVAQTESLESTRRKSSIPDANVTVDDLFEDSQTQVPTRSIESIEGTVEPSETIRNITSTNLDISIDDVFAGTSSETHRRNSIDFDKYIQRGRELKNNSSVGLNSTVAQTESLESTRRKSSIPDANVTVDDLFEDSQTQVPTRSIESIEGTVQPSETVRNITSTNLDISIDDVFAGTSSETHRRNSIDFDKYIQRGRELKNNSSVGFNSTVAQTESLESTRRKSSIPDANVTVDDLFEDSQTQVPTRSIESIEGTVQPSETVRNITSTNLDISIDDVFAGTSSETHRRNSIDFDKYIQRGRELKNNSSVGFNSTVAQTESLESTRRKSSIPDANVTVDDLFEDSQTQVPTRSIESIEGTVQPSETVRNITSTNLDISIDDVFAGTSSETHRRNSIDFDKYIQRGRELKNNSSVGFNSTVAQTESLESTRRKSSIPDANVTVDDLFEDSQTQVPTRSIESIEGTVQPSETVRNITSTNLDISIDDVFAGTSSETHRRNSIDFDKYIQRGRELKNNSSVGFNSTVAQTESLESTRRKSSIPDANVTVDDLFEDSQTQVPTRSIESIEGTVQPSETVRNITSTNLDISIDDVFAGTSSETHRRNSIDFDKYIQRGRELKNNSSVGFNSTVAQTESLESTRRKSSIPDANVTVDDLFEDSQTQVPTRSIESIEGTVQPSETVRNITSTDLDISIDDVFAGTSSETHKRNSIDFDKYIQRGNELKNNSSVGFNSTVAQTESLESTRRKSSIPDANVTVDDLFEDSHGSTRYVRVNPKSVTALEKTKADYSYKLDISDEIATSNPTEKFSVPRSAGDSHSLEEENTTSVSTDTKCKPRTFEVQDTINSNQKQQSFGIDSDGECSYSSDLYHSVQDELPEHRTRSKSVSSASGKKLFTVTFSGDSDGPEKTNKIAELERPEATRKIRKPNLNVERTSVFDIFNINSADYADDQKNESDSNGSVSSIPDALQLPGSLDESSSVSSSFVDFYRNRSYIPSIHSTSLTVSLDDLEKTDDNHIIISEPYARTQGLADVIPSRRYSIRTDELDENQTSFDFTRARSRANSKDFSDFYDDLKSPPHTPKKMKRRSIDFYYEEPMEMPIEEEVDVQDFVDEILNQSLDEAAFIAISQHRSLKKEVPRSTDTSIDRKQSEIDFQVISDMGTSSILTTSEQMTDKLFVSSTNRNSLYEAILTCEPDTSNGPTSPTILPKKEEMVEDVGINVTLDRKTFISEATVVMKENQSDNYVVRLLFPESPEETIIVQENYEESDDQSRNATNVSSNIKHIVEKMAPQQKDDEYLEVEVNSEYFIVHGKYSMIIHKSEPLGEMLSKIQTNSLDFTVTPKLRKILRQCLHNKISANNGTNISSRAFHMLKRPDPAYEMLSQMALNRFTLQNRDGNINFCTAENQICRPLLQNRIQRNLEMVEDHLFQYGPGGGYEEVKETILNYLKKFMNATHVQKKDLTLCGSGNTCYDVISHCLFESEDIILTNTPSYSRLFVDCYERAGCRVEAVPMNLNSSKLDLESFKTVLKEQREQGNTVKGIVLINPNNPLGITFTKTEVIALGDWAASNDLNLIVDESFSGSHHGTNTAESFLSYQHELKNPAKAVWFWSLSKDFGLPGVRIAIIHTPNQSLKEGLVALELIYPVSALAQDFASNLLSDYEWAEQFHRTKNYRIGKHYEFVSANLRALNLNYITATSGFYVLVDFEQKMSNRTFEEEEKIWKMLYSNGVFMTRGKDMKCSQAGWMRLAFGCDKAQVEEGIRRLHKIFGSTANVIGSINY